MNKAVDLQLSAKWIIYLWHSVRWDEEVNLLYSRLRLKMQTFIVILLDNLLKCLLWRCFNSQRASPQSHMTYDLYSSVCIYRTKKQTILTKHSQGKFQKISNFSTSSFFYLNSPKNGYFLKLYRILEFSF